MPVFLADDDLSFPDPKNSDEEGLLAVGGDLSPERLLLAYQQGIFPWYEPGGPLLWWSPDPRLLLKPSGFKLSHSLKHALNKPYSFKIDTAFAEVIQCCANVEERINKTWISDEMCEAYTQLHRLGYAHSFEIWEDKQLIGGLYGLSLGRAFFGESMFHHVRDASKLAFYYLCRTLCAWKFDFIDCQLPTTHLEGLGAEVISRHEFLQLLQKTLEHPTKRGLWTNLKG